MGAGTLWQCQASGCARGWRCTVRSLLCRPRLASSLLMFVLLAVWQAVACCICLRAVLLATLAVR